MDVSTEITFTNTTNDWHQSCQNTNQMTTKKFLILWNYITFTPNSLNIHVTSFEKLSHSCTLE